MQQAMQKTRTKTIVLITLAILAVGGTVAGLIMIKKNVIRQNVPEINKYVKSEIINIDASKAIGEMPYIYRSGIWIAHFDRNEYVTERFFSANMIGAVQIMEPQGDILRNSESFEDYKQKLEKAFAQGTLNRKRIDDIIKGGQPLIIGHWPAAMPKWLSSSSDSRRYGDAWWNVISNSPPKCYDYECTMDGKKIIGWAGVIDYTLKYYRNNLGVKNLGYYFGHEQNKDWMGTEEEFYKTYEATAKAAKNISHDILVGGAGSWGWSAKRLPCDPIHYNEVGLELCKKTKDWSMDGEQCKNPKTAYQDSSCDPKNKNFLEYSKEHSLPVDFLNYHMFSQLPFSEQHQEMADTMKKWIKDNGYSEKLALYPADWAYWSSNFATSRGSKYWYPFDQIDTEENSAYIVPSLYSMDKAGIKLHSHDFDITDPPVEKKIFDERKSEFIGDWAIFTRSQIIKPVFNAFKLTSLLYGKQENQTSNQIEVNNADDFITSVSSQTQDKSKTRVLLSNFIPQGDMLVVYLTGKFNSSPSTISTKNYLDQIKACAEEQGVTKEKIEICVKNILATITDPIIKARVQTQAELLACFKLNKDKVKCVDDAYNKTTDQQTKTDIIALKTEYEKILQYQKEPRQVAININNLPYSGKATLITYTIDKDHSNSCRYNKKTEAKITDTECGINGKVDKWVAQAKKEAKTKAKPAAVAYLKQLSYTNKQLNNLQNQVINPCLEEEKSLVCAQTKLTTLCANDSSLNCDKITQDLKDAYKKYQEAYDALFYYGKYQNITTTMWIDKINNDPNISLEGSKQIKQINIVNGMYQDSITMQPNSVVLVEISK